MQLNFHRVRTDYIAAREDFVLQPAVSWPAPGSSLPLKRLKDKPRTIESLKSLEGYADFADLSTPFSPSVLTRLHVAFFMLNLARCGPPLLFSKRRFGRYDPGAMYGVDLKETAEPYGQAMAFEERNIGPYIRIHALEETGPWNQLDVMVHVTYSCSFNTYNP